MKLASSNGPSLCQNSWTASWWTDRWSWSTLETSGPKIWGERSNQEMYNIDFLIVRICNYVVQKSSELCAFWISLPVHLRFPGMPPGFKGSKFSVGFPEISDLLVGRGYSELGIDGVRQKCFGSVFGYFDFGEFGRFLEREFWILCLKVQTCR